MTRRGERAGAPGCGRRVEPDAQDAVAWDDVAAGGQGFADEGVGLVLVPGAVAVQGAGEAGFGVAGGHPDGGPGTWRSGTWPRLGGCWTSSA